MSVGRRPFEAVFPGGKITERRIFVMHKVIGLCLGLLSLSGAVGSATAQTIYGGGSLLVLPVVARTASYQSTIYLNSPDIPTTLQVTYVGGDGNTVVGLTACNNVVLAAGQTVETDLTTLCGLPPLDLVNNPPSNRQFGSLFFADIGGGSFPASVLAYSRVQTPQGDGFSIEGFPLWSFGADKLTVTGLKRQAATPGYQTNCFVGSIGEAAKGTIQLYDGAGTAKGNPIAFNLSANQLVRHLDIFAVAGLPAGDYSNYRATYTPDLAFIPGPGFTGFCTVQNNTSFDADFRIGKTVLSGLDLAQAPGVSLFGQTGAFPNDRTTFRVLLRNPDVVDCKVVPNGGEGRSITKIELRLLDPNDVPRAGGNNLQEAGKIRLPGRDATGGKIDYWHIEVEGTQNDSTGDNYNFVLTCRSGSGLAPIELNGSGLPRTF
jgi:hypothetical protein